MRVSTFLVITLILGVLQVVFPDYLKVFGIKPDFLLAAVVMAGLFFQMRRAVIFGVSIGIFKDIFSLNAFGLNILLFGLWAYLAAKISRKISIEDNITRTLLVFVIALFENIASGLSIVYSGSLIPFGIFLRIVILGSLYTALPFALIFKITKIIDHSVNYD